MSTEAERSQRRTDELLRNGAEELSAQATVPFVGWPRDNEHAYLEGEALEIWEGQNGPVCRLRVSRYENLVGISGKGVGKVEHRLQPGMEVQLGLSNPGLKKAIDEERVGKTLYVAFERWGETRDGRRFRRFRVLVLPYEGPAQDESVQGDLSL